MDEGGRHTAHYHITMLRVDLAIDKERGHLTDQGAMQEWALHALARRVRCMGWAGARETRRAARWREGGPRARTHAHTRAHARAHSHTPLRARD
eukprot:511423-Pyramimonas_sp.AAC.1